MRLNNQALAEYSRTLLNESQVRKNSTSNVISVEKANRIIYPYNLPAAITLKKDKTEEAILFCSYGF